MSEQPRNPGLLPYRIAVRTAAVAAIFSLVVATLMLYDYCSRSKDSFALRDPAKASALDVLKAACSQQPFNKSIEDEIRKLDEEVNTERFRQQAFAYSGAGLLCEGIIVALLAAKWAATLRRKHPQLQNATVQRDWEASWTPAARWTVGGLFLVLAATATALSLPLRASVKEKPAEASASTADGQKPTDRTATTVAAPTATEGSAAKATPVVTSVANEKPTSVKPAPVEKSLPKENPTVAAASTNPLPAQGAGTPEPSKTIAATEPVDSKQPTTAKPSPIEKPAPRENPAVASTNPSPEAQSGKPGPSAQGLAREWPCFRGPGGSGISAYTNVPDDWDGPSGKNVVWKTPLALSGNSSPIVVAGRIYLTAADENKRQVSCYDVKTGKLLWQRDAPSTPDSQKPLELKDPPGYAACTMASDGRYVAAIFGNGDLAVYDLDGKLAWSKSLGIPDNPYGHAASLAAYKNLLLVPFDQGTARANRSKLRALDFATGNPVWEQARAVSGSWTTPIVIRVANRDQVVTAADPLVIAYDPATGKELWRAKCARGDAAPSPVSAGNFVIAAVNDSAPILAIRADGNGDVTASNVLWKAEDNVPDICSPLATEEFVFLVTSEGMLTCYDTHKGGKLWEEDLNDFKCNSSPSLVGKELYVFGESGKCWILQPSQSGVKRVRQTDLGEGCVTCPAFQDGRMYVRGKKNLFCIGQTK
jgi:outer membrane protein assembly factor BamB